MRTRMLGKTRIRVTELCMGCWEIGGLFWGPIDQFAARELLHRAYDAGITSFDTADVYGGGRSEAIIGRSFHDRRKDIVIISKAGYLPGADGAQRLYEIQAQRHDPRYLQMACEMSLWRLETDYIDAYLLHDPPIEVIRRKRVWDALGKLKKEGKIRYFGASTNAVNGVECINQGAEVIETPFNLLYQAPATQLLPLAKRKGVGILARSPFASGRLFQKGKDAPIHPYRFLARKDRSLTDAAIKYVLSHDAVSCMLAGMMRTSELTENINACKRPLLSKTDLRKAAQLSSG